MNPMQATARDVVERARAGDQVAMGILVEVRDNAKRGNRKAQESSRVITQYIKTHPQGVMGAEAPVAASGNTNPPQDVQVTDPKALSALWRCPLSQFHIVLVKASPFVKMWEAIVVCAHKAPIQKNGPLAAAINVKGSRLSNIVRRAILMQCLQNPGFPIARYCAVTGWELGE